MGAEPSRPGFPDRDISIARSSFRQLTESLSEFLYSMERHLRLLAFTIYSKINSLGRRSIVFSIGGNYFEQFFDQQFAINAIRLC